LRALNEAVRRSILMALTRRSTPAGRPPKWLSRVGDIRLRDISGDDDTILHLESPTLGDAAPDLYEQREFWPTRPDPDFTGLELFGQVVSDVQIGDRDSERFDRALLLRVARFDVVLNGAFTSAQLPVVPEPSGRVSVLDRSVTAAARTLWTETPSPRRVRVVGQLDMLRQSTNSFALRLHDQEVPAILTAGDVASLAPLFGRAIVVAGMAVYRASGRALRLDADLVLPAGEESPVWSRMPGPLQRRPPAPALRRPQGSASGVPAFFGTWPGDETDGELLAALERLR